MLPVLLSNSKLAIGSKSRRLPATFRYDNRNSTILLYVVCYELPSQRADSVVASLSSPEGTDIETTHVESLPPGSGYVPSL
jgi:hypothetical protein